MTCASILQGDCLSVLATLPDQSVQCCVTSPPYYGLRDYGTAEWEGGDPECDHSASHPDGGERGNRTTPDGRGGVYKSVCHKCGSIRKDSQIGLEETPDAYVAKLVAVFREVRRVLRDDGTLWLNLGDSYAGSNNGSNDRREEGASLSKNDDKYKGQKPGFDFGRQGKTSTVSKLERGRGTYSGDLIKPKDLIGIPWMVAFALRADGWYLRQDIIWHKPNPMPESVKDRCTKAHEYIFLLAKSQKYYYDYQAILEPANYDGRKDTMFKGSVKNYDGVNPGSNPQSFAQEGHERWTYKLPPIGGKKHVGKNGNPTYSGNTPEIQRMGKDGSGFAGHSGNYDKDGNLLTHEKDGIPARNKRSVWTVTTKPFKGAHFATFPPDLIEPCVLAGSARGDTVLDPFNGAGTTGMVALKHGREYIGIELNPDYVEMTHKRLASVQVEGL